MTSTRRGRDLLAELQRWYLAHCDGNSERSRRVRISALEPPGWALQVDVQSTDPELRLFRDPGFRRSEDDWMVCRRDRTQFHAYGGPLNLSDALACFLDWAEDDTRPEAADR